MVFFRNHSYNNESRLQVYFHTNQTRFDTEQAEGNSKMACCKISIQLFREKVVGKLYMRQS